MKEEIYLGIDAGSSGVKVCAFNHRGELLGKASRETKIISKSSRHHELDLNEYWEQTVAAINEMTQRFDNIVSIGLSVACPTIVLLDKNNNPICNAITYLDGRSEDFIHKTLGENKEHVMSLSSNSPSPSSCWVGTIGWLQSQQPELMKKVHKIVLFNGFLATRLGGKAGIDPTQAAYSGAVVLAGAPKWSKELLSYWNFDHSLLAPIYPSFAVVGRVSAQAAKQTGLKQDTAITLGSADTAAAAFAVGLIDGGTAFESTGTSGVITFCLEKPDFDSRFMNRYHVVPNQWLAHGAMSTTGGTFGWLNKSVWPEIDNHETLEQLARESEPGAKGLVYLPYLAGERSPIWDVKASGAWLGLRLSHTRSDMIRAAFEGTAFGLRQLVDIASKKWGIKLDELLSVGGGSRNHLWTQIKADILQVEYSIAQTSDAAAFGAAMIGATGAGYFCGVNDPDLPIIRTEDILFKPNKDKAINEVYDKHFGIYSALYPNLKETMHSLLS
ncbi:xylulokinase [Zophobihabitans entericus]|uniref:XylB n=1 Tax=Zophobihabitans entericus TaxID=1635327 RepID=A0A6G9IDH6_9GAMM|nr:FGGY-family carbohydrate kinase [Zophobihabitans entericus]QIQ22288.1 XylB [Zophobihabitans entericus]